MCRGGAGAVVEATDTRLRGSLHLPSWRLRCSSPSWEVHLPGTLWWSPWGRGCWRRTEDRCVSASWTSEICCWRECCAEAEAIPRSTDFRCTPPLSRLHACMYSRAFEFLTPVLILDCRILKERYWNSIRNIDVVKTCQQYFNSEMPSTLWRKRPASFDIKFSSSENIFCKITPYYL